MNRVKLFQTPLSRLNGPLIQRNISSTTRISPFTSVELSRIKSRLSPTLSCGQLPPHTVTFTRRPASEAAILIPLMNIAGEPHVLLEVRAAHMRSHAGEISFPGGKIDPEDKSIAGAALRETQEELGVPPDHVEVLGMLDEPAYSLGNRARVWPVVGFVHAQPNPSTSTDQILSSFPLTSLTKSPEEVSAILPFPLSALHDHHRRSRHHFRIDVSKPYYRFRVEDLVHWPEGMKVDELELWGLSGWFLNRLAWRLEWMERPEPETYEG